MRPLGITLKCLVLELTFMFVAVSTVQIPPELGLKRCNYNDVNLDCLKAAIQDAIPKLKNGSSELGIPVLEPVIVTEIYMKGDKNTPLNLNMKFKDIKIWGLATELTVQNLKLDKKKHYLEMNVTFAKPVMEGDYEAEGKLLSFAIAGDGPFRTELTDVHSRIRIYFKPVVRKGDHYWDVVKLDYEVMKVGHVKFRFEGLIKGNPALNDNLNQVFNENWQEMERLTKPAFSRLLQAHHLNASQRFFRRVPLETVFDGFKPQ